MSGYQVIKFPPRNKGLIDEKWIRTEEGDEIHNFLAENNDLMGIIESGLHGSKSLTIRKGPMNE